MMMMMMKWAYYRVSSWCDSASLLHFISAVAEYVYPYSQRRRVSNVKTQTTREKFLRLQFPTDTL